MWCGTSAQVLCLLTLLVMSIAACGNGNTTSSGEMVTREVGVLGEELLFDTERMTVTAGQSVHLRFDNTSVTTEHNWVLVRGDDEVAARVSRAGKLAGPAQGYIPDDMGDIIDHTRLLAAGEEAEITFSTPSPGNYIYICTVPGHYEAGMKGELVVTP